MSLKTPQNPPSTNDTGHVYLKDTIHTSMSRITDGQVQVSTCTKLPDKLDLRIMRSSQSIRLAGLCANISTAQLFTPLWLYAGY